MASVHELWRLHALVPLDEGLKSIFVEGSNWSAQISVDLRVAEVKFLAFIVSDSPREDGILREVRVRPVAGLIKIHEILKIRNLSGLPL